MVIGTYILIITLNVNGLNAPTKRHRLSDWIQKQAPYICCLNIGRTLFDINHNKIFFDPPPRVMEIKKK